MRIIGGDARGRVIEAPAGKNTRPTLDRVRENLFNMLQGEVAGSTVLDLFAGSGALSLEAVSRGAVKAVLVDHDRKAIETEKKNIEKLRYEDRTRILHCEWFRAAELLLKEKEVFDLVFLDPPYAMTDLTAVFRALVPLISGSSLVILEHEAGISCAVPDGYVPVKERAWGFCAVSIFALKTGE